MKTLSLAVLLAVASIPTQAADVGVSVSIGQPGFYGQLDIGGYPPPQVIYRQPRVGYDSPPMYLRVPPGHTRNWDKHCGAYNACNRQVYFVKDNWYNKQYAPRYQELNSVHHDENEGRKHGNNG
jgi:hypothetical protein